MGNYFSPRPRRKRARDLARAARQALEPAKRTGGATSFPDASVIDPFQEPFVAADMGVELAQQVAVEHRLPVLADDWLLPPLRLDLPPRDGVDRPAERA